jgi:hypothetical protein
MASSYKKIVVALGLAFDAAELATEVVASLGNRGGGKSNGAAVIAEGLIGAGVQVVVLDYVGIWFSICLKEDGKTASPYRIPVLGGVHGDISLAATSGAVVAEALASRRSSAILDISGFSKQDRCRFATDFAEAFFRAKKRNPSPVQLLLEEAQRFAPQKLVMGQERMLGAFEEIGEVGRNYGIGLHLISQRPQKINKDLLNLADVVFGYRTNGVLERKAIADWVQEKGAEGRDDVQGELPGLERGQAIVWCPSRRIYGKYAVQKKTTYDAGATPLYVKADVRMEPLDLGELEKTMGEAAEEARANDPRALRAEIASLRRSFESRDRSSVGQERVVVREVVSEKWLKAVEAARDVVAFSQRGLARFFELGADLKKLEVNIQRVLRSLDVVRADMVARVGATEKLGARREVVVKELPVAEGRKATYSSSSPDVRDVSLTKCARALLGVLAQRGRATDSQVAALSGYRRTSSTFSNGMSELRTKKYMMGTPDCREVTLEGKAAFGPVEPLPEGEELLRYWTNRLDKCAGCMLAAIYEVGTLSRNELALATDYRITSSTFSNGVSKLRKLDLVTGLNGGDLTIADVFMRAGVGA